MSSDEIAKSISVFANAESLHKGRNITGEIWMEIDGFEFPEKRWSDFPVIIMGWWLDALFKLWSGKKRRVECLFMDGSYSFVVSDESNGYFLQCYSETYSKKECEWEGIVDSTLLLRQVLNAAYAVIEECRKHNWETEDTKLLELSWLYINGVLNPQSG